MRSWCRGVLFVYVCPFANTMWGGDVSDPYAPAWRPAYTGPDPALGDVGSGRGFGADLYQLYKAGRSELPAAEASTESDGWR